MSTNQIAQMHAVLCPPRIGVDQTTANMTPDEAKHEYENRRVHHVIEQKYLNYLRPLKNLHDGLRRPTNNILKQRISKGDGIPTMLPAAATDIVADAPDQQELTIGTVALTDDNQTLLQAGVKQDSTLQLRKCNKGIGNGPVDSRMENRTEP